MKNYYKENYEAFIDKHKELEYIDTEECKECQVVIETDTVGNDVLGIKKNDRVWYLGSRYDNNVFIDKWTESFKVNSYKAYIYIFGLGDVKAIWKLAEKYPENNILVYEPDLSFLKTVMEVYDLKELINKSNVEILAGEEGLNIFSNMSFRCLDISNYNYCVFKYNVQYNNLYEIQLLKWNIIIQENIQRIVADKNTIKFFGKERLDNCIGNFYDCLKSQSILKIIDKIKIIDGRTAVLVSAGPSLDKNVQLLKEVKGKALIMAVDTAIKPVLATGIKPDITITIDSHKPKELFIYENKPVDIPIILNLQSNNDVVSIYEGKRFYEYNYDRVFAKVYGEEDYFDICLDSGGSVANDAFSFLIKAGFENIILIGQDLAYHSEKTHAGEAYEDDKKISFVKTDKHFLVEDIYGGKVYTEENMNMYRKWFENVIKNNEGIHVIDATEGGAKIHGTEIITFREAIDKYVSHLPENNYESAIRSIPELDESEVERRLNVLYNFPKDIEETKSDIKKAKRIYEELDELNRKNKYNSARFEKVIEELTKVNDKIENSLYTAFATYNLDDTEYGVLNEIYEDKENLYDEFKLIIDSGRKVLEKYEKLYPEIEKKVCDMVEDVKKCRSI